MQLGWRIWSSFPFLINTGLGTSFWIVYFKLQKVPVVMKTVVQNKVVLKIVILEFVEYNFLLSWFFDLLTCANIVVDAPFRDMIRVLYVVTSCMRCPSHLKYSKIQSLSVCVCDFYFVPQHLIFMFIAARYNCYFFVFNLHKNKDSFTCFNIND